MRSSSNLSRRANTVIHLAVMAAVGSTTALAATQNSTWVGSSGSTWSTATNWSPSGVPNNGNNGFSDYNVSIGAPSPTTLDISPTIDNLTISAGGILNILYNNDLTVKGPTLTDNGSIVVNSSQIGAQAILTFGANTALNGTGTLTLQQPGTNALVNASAGVTVTQAATHTIAGYGVVSMALVNNGTVDANVNGNTLTVNGATNNNLTFEAMGGGTLSLGGLSLTQGASGIIRANTSSAVLIGNTNVTGGTLTTLGTGIIQINGASTITNLTSSGEIDIPYNNQLNVTGSLVDYGLIVVNSSQVGAQAVLNFSSGAVVSGTGAIVLQQPGSNALVEGSLNQSSGHTIRGYGLFAASLINNGTVSANVNGNTLQMTGAITNNATLQATGGGTLDLNGITVTQGVAGQISAAVNSAVTITNANISSGTLTTASATAGNNASYVQINGNSTLNNVTSNAVVNIPYSQALNIAGNLTDNGTINVNSTQQGAVAILTFNGGTVSGTGTIVLESTSSNAQLDGTLTQAAGHTISGYGQINATLINNGLVNANAGSTLYIESPVVTNNNLMESTSGTLYFDSAVQVNNSTGTISANGGAITLANGTNISGGTLTAVSPNTITLYNMNGTLGYTANFNALTLSTGTEVDIPYNNQLNIHGPTFTDNGKIVINSNSGGAQATLLISSNTLLTGSGSIVLNYGNSNALLSTAPGVTLTQDVHHSIVGTGVVSAALVNNNIVNANVSGSPLTLNTYNMTNDLTFEASGGGQLIISGIQVTQPASGTTFAANGSSVSLSNANISGGSIATLGSGYFQIGGTCDLISVTSSALINLPYNNQLNVIGNLIDNGTIVVNSNQGGAIATLNISGGTISGSGSFVLEESNPFAQIEGSFNQSAGHSITGYGVIDATFINNGLINSNISGNTLVLQTGNKTNNATIEGTGGGNLVISGITVTQSVAGQITLANGSSATLNSANISGGLISGAGVYTVQGTTTLANLNGSSATIDVPYNQQLNIVGNLINSGTIVVNSNQGGAIAILNVSGGTISGSGSILLEEGNPFAQIDGTLTQSAGHSIIGYGVINAAFTNNGLVNSNTPGNTLVLQSANQTNNSLIEATNGGSLNINGITISQGAAGVINASSGTTVTLSNANISGGAINGPGVYTVAGTSTLINLTSSATILIPYNNELNLSGTVTDNGTIVVNSTQGGAIALFNGSGGTINGTGTILLNETGGNAQVNGPLTQGAGHSIVGFGQISGTFNNSGMVNANANGQSLYITGTTTNNGTFQASNGATLQITPGVLTNFAGTTLTGGTYEVDANSTISLTGSIVTNAATIILGGPSATFAAVTPLVNNQGSLTLLAGGSFATVGPLNNSGTVTTNALSGATAAGVLTINGPYNQSAGTTIDNGSIIVTGATAIAGGLATVGFGATFAGTPITVSAGAQMNVNGSLTSNPVLTANGQVIFGAHTTNGFLVRTLSSLTIGASGVVTVSPASNQSSRSLIVTTLSDSGRLDLSNNDLDAVGANLTTMIGLVGEGANLAHHGFFNGSLGITSSAAAANTTHLTALGVIVNNINGSTPLFGSGDALGTFDGTSPGATDVLVKYTYFGDANLDGKVDGSDYSRIDAGFLSEKTGPSVSTWFNGDFNYDGVVNGSDYTLIDNAFNTQQGSLAYGIADPLAITTAQVSAVPEPATLALIGIGTIGLLCRRRSGMGSAGGN